jgi:MOSC domain-containing protein YiiM
MHATLHSINVSRGGVPKLPRDSAWIDRNGVEGDVQRNRRVHGGPDRAVCLYSWDLIQALQAEGHAIDAGTMGENLTIAGADWAAMRPGTRLEIGPVVLELTSFTSPCTNIEDVFADGAFVRVSQKVRPGWSRVYARVLEPGTVRVGDAVILVAPSPETS